MNDCAMMTVPCLVTVAAGMLAPGHLGELTRYLPFELVDDVLESTRTVQRRVRALPSRVGIYFVLAMTLFPGIGYLRVWDKMTAALEDLGLPRPSEKALRDLMAPGGRNSGQAQARPRRTRSAQTPAVAGPEIRPREVAGSLRAVWWFKEPRRRHPDVGHPGGGHQGWRVSFDQTDDGTSPSAICLAEHRVEFRVGPELPDLLRAAAGNGDLGSPFQRLLARGHLDDRDSADGLRVRAVGDRSVGGHDARLLVFQSAGQQVHAGVQGLLDHRVRGLGHRGHVLVGDVVHRVGIERDQVPRHPMTPLSPACGRCGLPLVLQTSPPPGSHRYTGQLGRAEIPCGAGSGDRKSGAGPGLPQRSAWQNPAMVSLLPGVHAR